MNLVRILGGRGSGQRILRFFLKNVLIFHAKNSYDLFSHSLQNFRCSHKMTIYSSILGKLFSLLTHFQSEIGYNGYNNVSRPVRDPPKTPWDPTTTFSSKYRGRDPPKIPPGFTPLS